MKTESINKRTKTVHCVLNFIFSTWFSIFYLRRGLKYCPNISYAMIYESLLLVNAELLLVKGKKRKALIS